MVTKFEEQGIEPTEEIRRYLFLIKETRGQTQSIPKEKKIQVRKMYRTED